RGKKLRKGWPQNFSTLLHLWSRFYWRHIASVALPLMPRFFHKATLFDTQGDLLEEPIATFHPKPYCHALPPYDCG
ncbi:hypothetical protein PIB30_021714, partial [Stylosanthes scabra]|nr:hypothetical protein [Stylosanthes scabra]